MIIFINKVQWQTCGNARTQSYRIRLMDSQLSLSIYKYIFNDDWLFFSKNIIYNIEGLGETMKNIKITKNIFLIFTVAMILLSLYVTVFGVLAKRIMS